MPNIFPSLMAADQLNMQFDVEDLEDIAYGFHIDVMDNHFAPNLTFGPDMVNAIATITLRKLWVHLMLDKPADFLDRLTLPPASIVTYHFEATEYDQYVIEKIKEKKWRPSLAINPSTEVEKIFSLLPLLDHVVIMAVEPGFYGQPFVSSVVQKIEPLIGYRQTSDTPLTIAIDGGITAENIGQLAQKGFEDFAVGSAIFNSEDPAEALQILQQLMRAE